jgi:prepilin-type N-terminal cleavage/methylation domain-containing protein
MLQNSPSPIFWSFGALWSHKPIKSKIDILRFAPLKSTKKPARQGFTLVEMLVVIAVLSILMMLLQPALRNVLQKTTGLSCLNNLKKIATATFTYAGDHNNYIPGRDYKGLFHWQSYTVNAHLGNQVGYPPSSPQSGGLLHFGGYLQGPDVYFCPGRKSPDVFSLDNNRCNDTFCRPNNYWHNMYAGGSALMGYALAHNNFNFLSSSDFNFLKQIPILLHLHKKICNFR